MYHALTQGIRKTKLSPSTKGATADKFIITKKPTKISVEY